MVLENASYGLNEMEVQKGPRRKLILKAAIEQVAASLEGVQHVVDGGRLPIEIDDPGGPGRVVIFAGANDDESRSRAAITRDNLRIRLMKLEEAAIAEGVELDEVRKLTRKAHDAFVTRLDKAIAHEEWEAGKEKRAERKAAKAAARRARARA